MRLINYVTLCTKGCGCMSVVSILESFYEGWQLLVFRPAYGYNSYKRAYRLTLLCKNNTLAQPIHPNSSLRVRFCCTNESL